MTDSIDEKPTPRQQRLSPQAEDFDFDLAEVQVIPEQLNPEPSPLDQAGDDNNARPEANRFAASESLLPITPPMPEIKTNFYVDYFDKRKKVKTSHVESVSTAEASAINQASPTVETNEPPPAANIQTEQTLLDSQAPVLNGSGMAVAVLSQFKSKQESINKQQEKLIQEFSQKVKKATTVTYTAVFFGAISLVAAAGLGFMLLQTKSELSDLSGTTTALQDEIKNIKTSVPEELEGTDPALDQLSQKVDDVAEQLDEVTELQNKVAHLEKTAAAKLALPTPTPIPATKPSNNAQTLIDMAEKKQAENASAAKATAVKPETKIESKPATKTVKNTSVASAQTPISPTSVKGQNASKPVASKPNVPANNIPDKDIAIPANDINKVVNSNTPPMVSAKPATNVHGNPAQTGSSGWTVNLASSNKLEDAKKAANSFTQKGIPVTVTTVTIKNETRYRLQVKGFKSKEEAAAYASKAKDALKLNSVWINP